MPVQMSPCLPVWETNALYHSDPVNGPGNRLVFAAAIKGETLHATLIIK